MLNCTSNFILAKFDNEVLFKPPTIYIHTVAGNWALDRLNLE